MTTIIRVDKRLVPFVMIDNRVFEDRRMSWRAKGLLGYLLSRPPNWEIIVADLINQSTDGRDSVYAAIGELIKCGYATHKKMRANGKIVGTCWTINEEAGIAASGKTVYGKAVYGKTVSGKSATNNKDRSFNNTEYQKKKDQNNKPDPPSLKEDPIPEPQTIVLFQPQREPDVYAHVRERAAQMVSRSRLRVPVVDDEDKPY